MPTETSKRRRFLPLLAILLAVSCISLSGCDIKSSYGKLQKNREYLFELKNKDAEKYGLMPAFRGTVLRTRGKGKKEVLEIRINGAVRKVPRKAFMNVSAL